MDLEDGSTITIHDRLNTLNPNLFTPDRFGLDDLHAPESLHERLDSDHVSWEQARETIFILQKVS